MKLVKKSNKMEEHSRPFPREAGSAPGDRDVLAREPARDDSPLGNKPNCSQLIATHLRYILEQCGTRKATPQSPSAILVDLHSRDGPRTDTFKG